MKITNRAWLLLAAAGTCISAGSALAQGNGGVVNISGASLLENWSRSEASTNDFIDVDGDGIAGWLGTSLGGLPDQLALGGPQGLDNPGTLEDQELVIQYRVTGSVNGFIELLMFGGPSFVTTDSFDANGILGAAPGQGDPNPGVATTAYHNRTAYINRPPNAGVRTGAYNAGNPGGAPNRANTTTFRATYSNPDSPSLGGIRIDLAPLDVATFLAVQKDGGTPVWSAVPADAGYGRNPRNSVNKQGGAANADLNSQLPTLMGRNLFDPNNPAAADSNTIFDTNLLFAPIAPVVNHGAGIRRVTMSELQHMFTTGRAPSGVNYVVATRDVGSGTRNAFNNAIGVDPSWGNGDNIGGLSTTSATINLGAQYSPTNKGSNGGMESTLRNTRLGIGYVGTERGVSGSGSGSWLISGALEIADVQNDIYGGTQYVRPTTANLLNNDANGWVIGGQAVIASLGDPMANGAANGGTGWVGAFDPFTDSNNNGAWDIGEPFTDLNGNGVWDATNAEAGLTNTNPAMLNPFAARYINNISRSISAFIEVPSAPENTFMPGEFAASQFLLLAGLNNVHLSTDYTTLVPNPNFNQKVQDYIANPANGNVHFNTLFASYNTNSAGQVPTRTTGATYSDNVANGQNYINQAGNPVSYGGTLTMRNKVAGDFNGDGVRTLADATDMLRAWSQRNGGAAWTAPDGIYGAGAGQTAIFEVLGDFEGDGNFNTLDVRYWADGLATVNGNLDRKAGFTAVDNAAQTVLGTSNFFGTTLANPNAIYNAGDSRADVSNASGLTARGWAPIGADRNNGSADADDNRIDASDIDYIFAQFMQNDAVTDGAANWSDLDEAVSFDLSADITGDLIVDMADVTELVEGILETSFGDVNLDGVCNDADATIAQANLGMMGGWAMGDVNGDGMITQADLDIINGCANPCPACAADFDQSGGVDGDDITAFFNAWQAGETCGDVDGSGGVDGDDIPFFFVRWEAGGC